MGIVESIIYPKTYFGLTDLKTGAFIIALVEFILTVLSVLGLNNRYSSTLALVISLVCSGLGAYGVKKDNKSYVHVYYIYILVCAVFALFVFCLSFISFSLSFIIVCFITFVISLYNYRVVRAYYHEMTDSSAATEAAGKV